MINEVYLQFDNPGCLVTNHLSSNIGSECHLPGVISRSQPRQGRAYGCPQNSSRLLRARSRTSDAREQLEATDLTDSDSKSSSLGGMSSTGTMASIMTRSTLFTTRSNLITYYHKGKQYASITEGIQVILFKYRKKTFTLEPRKYDHSLDLTMVLILRWS